MLCYTSFLAPSLNGEGSLKKLLYPDQHPDPDEKMRVAVLWPVTYIQKKTQNDCFKTVDKKPVTDKQTQIDATDQHTRRNIFTKKQTYKQG